MESSRGWICDTHLLTGGGKITFLEITVEAGEFHFREDAGAIQQGLQANTWKAKNEIPGGSLCESVHGGSHAGGGKGMCSLSQGPLVSFRSFTLLLNPSGNRQLVS